jgi:Rrf2 family protein
MKLSMKADYAFRVLFTLVEQYGRASSDAVLSDSTTTKTRPQVKPISIRELAERNDTPKPFLEHIMLELKSQGWAKSLPGKRGGYVLAKPPERISMGEIVRYFEGLGEDDDEATTGRGRGRGRGRTKAPAPAHASVRFRRVMREMHHQAAGLMDQATLASVFAGRPVSKDEVLAHEFRGGDGI